MITCEYCKQSFKRESTAAVHMCEKKRRWMQKDMPETIAGFTAFDLFFRLSMQSKPKVFAEFVDSPYYSSFVNFGSYCLNCSWAIASIMRFETSVDLYSVRLFYFK